MVAQSSQALPSKSHRDHPTVSWASESAKALFHETKLLLAPMKFPRPGLRWVRPEGHVFGGSKLDVLGKRLLRSAIISSTGWVGMVVFGNVCDDCTSPTRSLQHLVWQCSTCQQYSNYPATWCAAKQNLSNLLTIGILIVKWQKIDCLLPSKIIQTKNNISTPIEVSFSEGGTWIRSPEAVQQKKYPRRSPRPFWGTFWSRKRGNRSIWSTQCSIASRSTHIDTYSKTSGWFFSHLHEDLLFEAFQQVPMLNKLHDPPVARLWHLIDVYHMALNLLVIIGIEEETPQYILLFSNDVDIWDSSPVEPTHQPILSKRPHQEFRFQLPCIDPAIQQDPSNLATHQFVEGWNNRLCIQWMQHTSP